MQRSVEMKSPPAVAPGVSDIGRPGVVFPLLAGGLAWVVYWRTMAPTIYGVDSAELTTVVL